MIPFLHGSFLHGELSNGSSNRIASMSDSGPTLEVESEGFGHLNVRRLAGREDAGHSTPYRPLLSCTAT